MAEEKPASTDAAEDKDKAVQADDDAADDYNAWEAQRRAELRGEQPQESAPKPSEAPAPEAGEPKKAESAGDPEPPEKKQEQDTDADPDKKAEADKKPGKGKGGFQRRIDRLTRDKRELEERLAELEAKPAGDKPAGDKPGQDAQPKPEAEGEPKAEDFDTYEEFSKAQTNWLLDQREQARTETEQRTRDEEVQRTVFENWTKRLDASREAHEDFDEVTDADIPLTPAMQQAMLDSEHGAELAYYLGQHPDVAERIAQLTWVGAVRELGRIEVSFGNPGKPEPETSNKPESPAPQPKSVSKAPAPVKPIRGGTAGGGADVYDENHAADYNAWETTRRAQLRRKAA